MACWIGSVRGRKHDFQKADDQGKTLLQKSFPPGPPFRKLPYVCGLAMSQRQIGLAAHERYEINADRSSLRSVGGDRFLARKSLPDALRVTKTIHFERQLAFCASETITCRHRSWRPLREMNINESNEVYGRITRVINELKMDRKPVTVFKVCELTGLDPLIVFNYFYEKGLLKGK